MSPWNKRLLKKALGEVPLAAELYWQLRQQGRPPDQGFSLQKMQAALPEWLAQAQAARQRGASASQPGKRILLFATLRYWIEHAALLGVALSGLGHEVNLAYLPYPSWQAPLNRFDQRRQSAYVRKAFQPAQDVLHPVSWLEANTANTPLPEALHSQVEQIALRDAQYTLQVEEIDRDGPDSPSARLYQLRLERNAQAARAALDWVRANRPDVAILPNGSILEMGAVYAAARHLGLPVVTYEFGEQRERIWLAQNAEVMRQETDALWAARRDQPLDDRQWEQVQALFASRQKASLWENFSRRWQGVPSLGGEAVRRSLSLDERPILLLAANVIGDSLTLGRQVFSDSMTEWLERTVRYFAGRTEMQMVVRIHPGERYTKGPSVADVVRRALPDLPAHFRLVGASDPVNTYDLVEIADLGLVYTTTAGLEMAMSGTPVIVVGQTHYRGKGFTVDPDSWQAYFQHLEDAVQHPEAFRMTREQIECAWNYAYRFFFEYPFPFPWHLLHFWKEMDQWPVERVLSEAGLAQFGPAFRCLVGEPRQWDLGG